MKNKTRKVLGIMIEKHFIESDLQIKLLQSKQAFYNIIFQKKDGKFFEFIKEQVMKRYDANCGLNILFFKIEI